MKTFWRKKTEKPLMKKDAKLDYPNPNLRKVGKVKGFGMSKKAQMMLIGILVVIMALLVFIATLPATKELIDNARGCSWLNCNGYIDKDASGAIAGAAGCTSVNQSYNSHLEEDGLSCTILDLAIPFLILGVLVALIYKITRGESVEPPAYSQYGGGY